MSSPRVSAGRDYLSTGLMLKRHPDLEYDPTMHIALILDASRLWRWHLTLVDLLSARADTRVSVAFSPVQRPLDPAVGLVLMLEASITKRAGVQPFEVLRPAAFDRWYRETQDACDLVIDLAALELGENPRTRTLVPLYNGVAGGSAFWSAILDGKAPFLSILDSIHGVIAVGQPAMEAPHALGLSAGGVVTRVISGLLAASTGPAPTSTTPFLPDFGARAPGLTMAAANLLGRKVACKARRFLDRQLASAPQWATAWRMRKAGFDPLAGGDLRLSEFKLLADDGQRFFADPFLFAQGDDIDVFVEELPYATGRGIISVFTVRADGTATAPRPVLEAPHHLSYPHVFAHGGAIWMLPEGHASGGLTLYRATRYPDQWEAVARIVDEPVHDATLFEHGGRLWIAANTEGPAGARWGSSWDSLSLFSAPTLFGPWTPHADNPVLIDAGSARPAGAVFSHKGALYRPVQDCRGGYGIALGIAQITRLDDADFAQQMVARLAFAVGTGAVGPHTLSRLDRAGGTFEAIDLFAPARKLAAVGRGIQG